MDTTGIDRMLSQLRTAQALAIGLSTVNGAGSGACLVIFETLAGRG